VVAGTFIVALVVRLAGIHWGLPATLEEAYPLKTAWTMSGLAPGSHLDLNPHFFRYPTLYIYMNLVVLMIVRAWLGLTGHSSMEISALYLGDPTAFYLASRALTALLGALAAVPVYALGRRAGGRPVALLAATLVALNPLLIQKSQMIEVDIPLTLLVTVSLALSVVLADRGGKRTTLLAGAVVGLAASMKYPGFLGLIPIGIALATRAKTVRGAVINLFLATLAALVAFFVTSPFVLLDSSEALRDLAAERMHLRLGHFGSEAGFAWQFYLRSWFTVLLGWVLGTLAIAGLVMFAILRRAMWAVLGGALILAFWVTVAGWALKADRYLMPVVPVATIFAAAAIVWAFQKLPRRLAVPVLALGVLGFAASDVPRWRYVLGRQQIDPSQLAKQWINQHIPDGSMCVVEPYGPTLLSPLTVPTEEDLQQIREHPDHPPSRYWLVPIPIFQVAPERTAVYYDPRLYGDADVWVTAGAVRERYRREPDRFPNQNALYNWLDTHWTNVMSFEPGYSGGSEIKIYQNPMKQSPFGARVTPPPAPLDMMRATGGIGGESTFYFNLGGNYYGFGYPREAATCFQYALSFPNITGGVSRERLISALELANRAASGR